VEQLVSRFAAEATGLGGHDHVINGGVMASAERLELEIYSHASNAAIVRMPGRKFPGVVVQGDSLRIMLGLAEDIWAAIGPADSDLSASAEMLRDQLHGLLTHYEAVMAEHRLPLPYSRHNAVDPARPPNSCLQPTKRPAPSVGLVVGQPLRG
jgi:hypothetical protein